MRVKKAIKKLVALGAGVTMVGATIMGATAADLNDYPAPFVSNGAYNAMVVVGEQAATIDVVGAIDLAADLQYWAREQKSVSTGGGTTVSVDDGAEIAATGDDLNIGEGLIDAEDKLKKGDLPVLLADGIVEDDSNNDEFNYDQELQIGNQSVTWGNPDDDVFDKPILYIDQSSGVTYTLVIDFDEDLEADVLDDSETITMAGRTFTFKADMDATDSDLILFASEVSKLVNVGETETITLDDGSDITIEVIGGNTDDGSATMRLTSGGVTKTKQVEAGDTVTVGSQSVYINQIFSQTVPEPTVGVEIFIGSDELTLPLDVAGDDTTWEDVEVDGSTLDGYEVNVAGNLTGISSISFRYTPSDRDDDELEYLEMGEEEVDPLFKTFKMIFGGVTPEVDSDDKTVVEIERSGDVYSLKFVNTEDDEYELDVWTSEGMTTGNVTWAEDFAGATVSVADDQYFILPEGDVTRVWQLNRVYTDNSIDYAEVEDLADGGKQNVKTGDEIGDTGITVTVDSASDLLNLSGTSVLTINTKFDGAITLEQGNDESTTEFTFAEDSGNIDESEVTASTLTVDVQHPASGDEDIEIDWTAAPEHNAADEDDEVEYGLTQYGTYTELEVENSGDWLKIYYGEEETDVHVFIAPVEGAVSTSGVGGTVTYYETNKIGVGAATLDTKVVSTYTSKNVIVVGGPCANVVAAKLMGEPANCAEGFEEGKAMIKLYDTGAGKSALLVAGFSGTDTLRATKAIVQGKLAAVADGVDEVQVITVTETPTIQVVS